jgi:predicted peptidase
MPDPQGDVQPGTQELRAVRGAAADTIQQYHLYRPRDDDRRELWPILLFLHGRGEGRHNRQQTYQGIDAVMNHGTPPSRCLEPEWRYPFIIVSPQLPAYVSRWHEEQRLREIGLILDDVIQWYQGDPNQVYATGFSIGGLGAVAIAAQGERRLAALLPVDLYDPPPQWNPKVTNQSSVGTPVWSHHARTNNVAPGITGLLTNTPRQPTLYDLDHVRICREVYNNADVYAWLLEHSLL